MYSGHAVGTQWTCSGHPSEIGEHITQGEQWRKRVSEVGGWRGGGGGGLFCPAAVLGKRTHSQDLLSIPSLSLSHKLTFSTAHSPTQTLSLFAQSHLDFSQRTCMSCEVLSPSAGVANTAVLLAADLERGLKVAVALVPTGVELNLGKLETVLELGLVAELVVGDVEEGVGDLEHTLSRVPSTLRFCGSIISTCLRASARRCVCVCVCVCVGGWVVVYACLCGLCLCLRVCAWVFVTD
jgi:hypothetical protein